MVVESEEKNETHSKCTILIVLGGGGGGGGGGGIGPIFQQCMQPIPALVSLIE